MISGWPVANLHYNTNLTSSPVAAMPVASPQARQLEAAHLGSQRTEEQLVALSTQLSAAQEMANEAAEAQMAAAREAASGEVAQAQAAAEEARGDLERVQAELASVQAELAVFQEGGFSQIVSGAGLSWGSGAWCQAGQGCDGLRCVLSRAHFCCNAVLRYLVSNNLSHSDPSPY